jgi:hypothetical protein
MKVLETVHASNTLEIDTPNYRVNFWRLDTYGAWALEAFILSEASDVNEVLTWVGRHSDGRRVEVFVESGDEPLGSFEDSRSIDLIRLMGSNFIFVYPTVRPRQLPLRAHSGSPFQ